MSSVSNQMCALLQVRYWYLCSTENRYRSICKCHMRCQGEITQRSEGFGNFGCLDFVISWVSSISPWRTIKGMNKVTVRILHVFDCSSLFSNFNEIKWLCWIACKERHKWWYIDEVKKLLIWCLRCIRQPQPFQIFRKKHQLRHAPRNIHQISIVNITRNYTEIRDT